MVQLEQPEDESRQPSTLSERALRYKEEIEKVVREVGEHPLCEMKRSCSLRNLAEKIEFVKDVQSIATSRIETEKFLIIGADEATKSFCAVQNLDEFDEAVVHQVLDKYLSPVPEFELFRMTSSDGHAFVLLVIPKQKRRRILAKVTVEDQKDLGPRTLLREGELWTKGASTGKRLARPEDWDEIYEDVIESEAERRTRERTAHALDLALARDKVRPALGSASSLPSYFTDQEFQALMEDLCSTQNEAKFLVLLERLRDDLVEGWHEVDALLTPSALTENPLTSFPYSREKAREHIKNVFRPGMHWLTLAGMYVIKNSGPIAFLDAVVDMHKEVFDASSRLGIMSTFVPYRATSSTADEHVSHTVPALESLTSLYLIGAYLSKRNRFGYLRSLFRACVYRVAPPATDRDKKQPMVFWPLGLSYGEPEELRKCGGRISFCAGRVKTDSTYLKLFGSVTSAEEALCQYEFSLELNSFVAFTGDGTAETADYIAKTYPDVNFVFFPGLIAYSLEYIHALAASLFAEIRKRKPGLLTVIFFDQALAEMFVKLGGEAAFLRFLRGIAQDQAKLFMERMRFPPFQFWPKEIAEAFKKT